MESESQQDLTSFLGQKPSIQALIDYRRRAMDRIDWCWKKRDELRLLADKTSAAIEAHTKALQLIVKAVADVGDAMLTLGCTQEEVDRANRPESNWSLSHKFVRDPAAMVAEFPSLQMIFYSDHLATENVETCQTA